MILTSNDYKEMASQIQEEGGEIYFEKDDEILVVEYDICSDGHIEYYQTTGPEFIETRRDVWVKSAESFNEDGKQTPNNFDEVAFSKVA